jgi:hypothetical protein
MHLRDNTSFKNDSSRLLFLNKIKPVRRRGGGRRHVGRRGFRPPSF